MHGHKDAIGVLSAAHKDSIKIVDTTVCLPPNTGMPDTPSRTHLRAPLAKDLIFTVLMVSAAAIFAIFGRSATPPGSVALIFLVSVLFSAVLFGFWAGIVASALAFLAYNFFFVEPYLTLRVTRAEDFLALGVFVLVAGLTGSLAGRLREQAKTAQERAALLQHLSQLSRTLGAAKSEAAARQALLLSLRELTGVEAVILDHSLTTDPALEADDLQAADRALRHASPQVAAAEGWSSGRYNFHPLGVGAGRPLVAGVNAARLSPEGTKAVTSAIEQTGASIAALRLACEADAARLQAERESLRSALLSSLSHDLKTPLATILGSVTALRQFSNALPENARDDLLHAVEEEARRLNTYVGDLLHMTRLQAGLDPRLDWVDPRDILNGAATRIRREFAGRQINTRVGAAPALFKTDAALLEQAVFNCLHNAAVVAPVGTAIELRLDQEHGHMRFIIEDEGPGVPLADQQRMFEAFQRGANASHNGTGLGLAITKGIVQALGGRVGVDSPLTEQGGSRFWLELPMGEERPA